MDDNKPSKDSQNAKEHLYDKVHISIKTLDKIIRILIFLLFAAMVIGILKGNGIL